MGAAALLTVTLSGCSSRQHRADEATRGMVPLVVAELDGAPRATWARPSAETRDEMAVHHTVYRVLGDHEDGSTSIAVWHVDRGRTIWSDDTPRTGLACARVLPTHPLTERPEECPDDLPAGDAAAHDAPAESVDWSDASRAHDEALIDVHTTITDAQWAVKEGRVSTVADLRASLEAGGLTVTPRPGGDATTLRATVSDTAAAPLLSDASAEVDGTVCTELGMSIDAEDPYYFTDQERAC